jgi:hypothetical protein
VFESHRLWGKGIVILDAILLRMHLFIRQAGRQFVFLARGGSIQKTIYWQKSIPKE